LLIINRYIIREIFTTLVAVATVLFLILFSGQLAKLFSQAASGALQADTIMTLLGLKSIANLDMILPLSFYLAILLAFSRLYKDNEIAVLSACGISQLTLLRPVINLAIVFALIVGFISIYLSPWAQDKSRFLIKKGEATSDVKALTAGRFKETPGGGGVIYIENTSDEETRLRNVFIQRDEDDHQTLISSAAGYQYTDPNTNSRFLVLEKGYRYEGRPGTEDYLVIRFQKHGIRLVDKELLDENRRQKEIPTSQLWDTWRANRHDRKQREEKYSQVNRSMAELQWRVSPILLCIILGVVAVPLSKTSARQGRYTKLGLALLIYIIYTNLLNLSRVWLEQGRIHYSIGVWWVHFAVLIIAMLLFAGPQTFGRFFSSNKNN